MRMQAALSSLGLSYPRPGLEASVAGGRGVLQETPAWFRVWGLGFRI